MNTLDIVSSITRVASSSSAGAGAAAGILGLLGAFYAAIWAFYCIMILAAIVGFVIWIWMLVDCLRREDFDQDNEKLIWAVVIVFAGILGALIYYFLIKRKHDRLKKNAVGNAAANAVGTTGKKERVEETKAKGR